ncbi:MAG: dihydroorotase [Flavobacteriales bacterium]|nr:dihydroorotase [Flavobacteriales bacterium]
MPNNQTLLIRNAKVVNEGQIKTLDLFVDGVFISKIAPQIDDVADVEINAMGKLLLPGLIDDQVHFREPGLTHKGTIQTESRAAVAGGITTFFEMPNTNPQTTSWSEFQNKIEIAKTSSWANFGFMFGGTNDNLNEVLAVDPQLVPGIKLFLGSSTGNMLVDNHEVLRDIFSNTKLPISVHCEDEQTIQYNLSVFIEKYGDDIPMSLHSQIRSEEACYISSSKAVSLAKETGARLHVFHLSTAKETELFDSNFDVKTKNITSEVCIHHLWFSDADYDEKGSLIRWNPAVKTAEDRHALWTALNDNRIDIIATDHAPHTMEEKMNPYTKAPSGGPMVQHALSVLLECHLQGKISIEKIVEKMAHNPAKLFDIDRRGFVREGYFADLVLVDMDAPYTVSKENILYKCGWSPLEGQRFRSRVTQSIVSGVLTYDNGMFSSESAAMAVKFKR